MGRRLVPALLIFCCACSSGGGGPQVLASATPQPTITVTETFTPEPTPIPTVTVTETVTEPPVVVTVTPEPAPVPAPDPATVRQFARALHDHYRYGLRIPDGDLDLIVEVWFEFYEEGRDADAATAEWFIERWGSGIRTRDDARRQEEQARRDQEFWDAVRDLTTGGS